VDELRTGLELATDEELHILTDVLFQRKFNPLDYLYAPDPIDVQSLRRQEWIDTLEERFRFLAADGLTVLRGQSQTVSYRQVLIQLCRFLKLPYGNDLKTTDIEAEVFLHLLSRAWKQMSPQERRALSGRVQQSLHQSEMALQLPASFQRDPLGLILKGSSALAVSSVLRPLLLKHIARQFALHAATHQVAKQTLVRGGAAIATQVQSRAALTMASRGMALNAARYGAVRSAFALLGPALWAWFLADLGWRAIATNYGRVIPVVFTLAQIRLTRSECWELA
jgi:uncharacterized protein YaaW (UPF0174 family)